MDMPAPPLRVLITGFGPFPGIPENASEAFAPLFALRAAETFRQLRIACDILPTEWTGGPQRLQRRLDELQPHICLHFGVQGGASGLVLETIARNLAGDKSDAAGVMPDGSELVRNGPHMLLPLAGPKRLLGEASRTGLPVAASVNAGNYLCNAIFYHSLLAARVTGRRRVVALIHLPVRVGGAGRADDPVLHRSELPLDKALTGSFSILSGLTSAAQEFDIATGTELAPAQ